MIIKAFITHKKAENFSDCQDRFGVDAGTKSIAVSDGMGSTWQQKIWAQILVDKYVSEKEWEPSHDSIKPLCEKWRKEVAAFIQDLKDKNAPENMIYRNERNLAERRSAGATLVGIRFTEKKWSGTILGDSCLIEWKNEKEVTFHTSQENVDSFDSYPDYFDSDNLKQGKGTPKPIEGELSLGTTLFMVSDPFSEFLYEHNKQGDINNYLTELTKVSNHNDFESLVETWRNLGMHNDDTTLVIVENGDSESFVLQEPDNIQSLIETEKGEIVKTAIAPKQNRKPKETNNSDSQVFLDVFQKKLTRMVPEGKLVNLKFKKVKKALEEVLKQYTITKK